ncbi:hypothetical protein PRIPAC_81775 [Pristionchus pacificus]|uniref:Serpentine receptor class gamma n=1 Tax=Pristionchus pacificus TaxID=54126 RepID=A0A2A6C1P8_PRIPA|nr:hypothetical protein PRIPAC_81775 [Pristionchus pacificus]|eukprot:PDM72172.1 G protein-coupled receptor [Pristionchus pacificus]
MHPNTLAGLIYSVVGLFAYGLTIAASIKLRKKIFSPAFLPLYITAAIVDLITHINTWIMYRLRFESAFFFYFAWIIRPEMGIFRNCQLFLVNFFYFDQNACVFLLALNRYTVIFHRDRHEWLWKTYKWVIIGGTHLASFGICFGARLASMNANVTFIYNDVVQSYELRGDADSKPILITMICYGGIMLTSCSFMSIRLIFRLFSFNHNRMARKESHSEYSANLRCSSGQYIHRDYQFNSDHSRRLGEYTLLAPGPINYFYFDKNFLLTGEVAIWRRVITDLHSSHSPFFVYYLARLESKQLKMPVHKPCCDKAEKCKCCSPCVDCDCCKSGKCGKSDEPCCSEKCKTEGCKCERTEACHKKSSHKPCCDKPEKCKCCSPCVDCDCCKSGKCGKSDEPCCSEKCKTEGCKCERTEACHKKSSHKPCCDKPEKCKCCSPCVDCDCCKSGKCGKSDEPCCSEKCKTEGCKCERTDACHKKSSHKPCCDKPEKCKCCSPCVDCDCCKSGKCGKSDEPCCSEKCKTEGCKCERTEACHKKSGGCCSGKKCCHTQHKEYEAVCERISQELAQAKNVDSLKLCELVFSRVLMTMGILFFVTDPSLAPDDVTSKSSFCRFLGP